MRQSNETGKKIFSKGRRGRRKEDTERNKMERSRCRLNQSIQIITQRMNSPVATLTMNEHGV